MVRTIVTVCFVYLGLLVFASAANAGEWAHYWGLGWTDKYYSTGGCPGFIQGRPLNPFLAVPLHSGYGQTTARRQICYPPVYNSPLYNNSPRLCPFPNGARGIDDCLGVHRSQFFLHPPPPCPNGNCDPHYTR